LIPTTTIAGEIGHIIESKLPSSREVIRLSGTSQNSAFSWISENFAETKLDITEEERVLELYSLVVFYYSTDGDNWSKSKN